MTEQTKKWIAGGAMVLFAFLLGLVFWFAGKPMIQFVSEPDRFRAWVDSHGFWARAAFLGMVILQVIVAIIPGEPLEIAAGYAFGFWEGTMLCFIGMTIGGALVFLFVRRFGIKAVEVFIPREKILSLKFLQNSKRVYGFTILAFLLPGTPKDILSYAAGLTPISLPYWLLITSFCRLPSIVTSTIGGDALGSGQLLKALLFFVIAIILALIGMSAYQKICHHTGASMH